MPALIAHPLSVSSELPLPPAALALGATVLVAAMVNFVRVRRTDPSAVPAIPEPWPGQLPRALWASRLLGVAGLVGLIYVGRFGPRLELDNLASPVVTGVLWPLLLTASLVGGVRLWRALDPLDTLVRAGERLVGAPATPEPQPRDATEGSAGPEAVEPRTEPVWPALVAAVAWTAYLHGYARTTPQEAAYAVAGYTVVLVAGGIALGRHWLASADGFSLLARWCGLRTRLAAWDAPRGAEAVTGALIGGMLFGDLRMSPFYIERFIDRTSATLTGTSVPRAVAASAAGAVLAMAAGHWARRRGAPGSVAAVLVPIVAALAFSTLLRRLLICLQLVWVNISDPLGRGADYFGTGATAIDGNPFGTITQRWMGVAAVTAAGMLSGYVLARRVPRARAQDPAAITLYVVVALGVRGAAATF